MLGEHALDFGLLALCLGIVLVDVDQQHTAEHTLHLFGSVELDVVDVVFAQGGWQDEFAERTLVGALPADEHRHEAVAVVTAALLPLGHHGEEPAVEHVGPATVVGGYAAGKLADVVGLSVPGKAAAEVVGDGVVVGRQRGADIEFHIYRPCHADLQHLLEGDAAQLPVGQLLPTANSSFVKKIPRLFFKIIRLFFKIISLFLKIIRLFLKIPRLGIFVISHLGGNRPEFLLLLDGVVT